MNPLKNNITRWLGGEYKVTPKDTYEEHEFTAYYPKTGQVEISGNMVIDLDNWRLIARPVRDMTPEEIGEFTVYPGDEMSESGIRAVKGRLIEDSANQTLDIAEVEALQEMSIYTGPQHHFAEGHVVKPQQLKYRRNEAKKMAVI